MNDPIKKQIEQDLARYSKMLEQLKSGAFKHGELNSSGWIEDKTPDAISHIERIIQELRSVLSMTRN